MLPSLLNDVAAGRGVGGQEARNLMLNGFFR